MKKTAANDGLAGNDAADNADRGLHGAHLYRMRAVNQAGCAAGDRRDAAPQKSTGTPASVMQVLRLPLAVVAAAA
jgi:hypothetical protein